jgi:hypothetical protein
LVKTPTLVVWFFILCFYPYELQFLFVFQFICPKSIFSESFKWGIIFMDFVGFPFETSKLKKDNSYIKYKFSHRFGKVCSWLNMYYSKIRIIIFFKVTTMFIWIILKNLVWTCKECNLFQYWVTIICIYPPMVHLGPT